MVVVRVWCVRRAAVKRVVFASLHARLVVRTTGHPNPSPPHLSHELAVGPRGDYRHCCCASTAPHHAPSSKRQSSHLGRKGWALPPVGSAAAARVSAEGAYGILSLDTSAPNATPSLRLALFYAAGEFVSAAGFVTPA